MQGSVVITGLGLASSLGTGVQAHRQALWSGASGIGPIRRFDTSRLATRLGAMWPGWDGRAQAELDAESDLFQTAEAFPLHELALVAAREAWSSSGASAAPRRVALVFGTCFGQGFREFDAVTRRIAAGLDIAGPTLTISTACASSTTALGVARDLIARGHADVAVAGGADSLLREAHAGFSALGVLSAEPAAPFSSPEGTTLGEGAAFFVLERGDAVSSRAVRWATVEGYGLSADAYHETTPHPEGAGVARALRSALQDAGWRSRDVDFVSAHATGTSNNDRVEWAVIARELGASGRAPAVSGSKAHLGHTQGASGALELALALLCHQEGCAPPTKNFRGPRAGCPDDPVAGETPRPVAVSRAIKLSAAFGGANSALAYSCGAPAPRPARARAAVVLRGVGLVGPAGTGGLDDVLELTSQRMVGPAREVDRELDTLGVDPRRLDRSSRWLTAATARALASRGDGPLDRTGLFVAATRMPEESARRCVESIRRRGVGGTSASAFARMSVNAPTGACTVALGLLGPTNTLSSGDGSGITTFALAAEWLAFRDDADEIVAAAVDELGEGSGERAEGAGALLLSRADAPRRGDVVVADWSIAGADRALEVAAKALGRRERVDAIIVDACAGVAHALGRWLSDASAVRIVDGARLWGEAEATRSLVFAAVGAAHIARGVAESVLLVSARGSSSVAVVLERGDAR